MQIDPLVSLCWD